MAAREAAEAARSAVQQEAAASLCQYKEDYEVLVGEVRHLRGANEALRAELTATADADRGRIASMDLARDAALHEAAAAAAEQLAAAVAAARAEEASLAHEAVVESWASITSLVHALQDAAADTARGGGGDGGGGSPRGSGGGVVWLFGPEGDPQPSGQHAPACSPA